MVTHSTINGLLMRSSLVLLIGACGSPEASTVAEAELPSYDLIEHEPLLTIESTPATADERSARVVGAYRLQNGNTVVASERELVWYDTTGTIVHDATRVTASGDRDITWMMGFNGDSLMAYDAASSSVIVLNARGTLVREFEFGTGTLPGMTLPHSILSDGSLLAVAGPSHVQQWHDGWWAVLGLLSVSPSGAMIRSLGTALRHPCGSAVERCAAEFTPYTGSWAAGQRGVYLARPDRADIRRTSNDSVVVLNGPAGWARAPQDSVPTYSILLLDPSENLWAQSGDLARVALFTPEGDLAGIVEVPSSLQLYQVGDDHVVGVVADEGTERVQVHRLRRN
jgi:hypothetical protein